MSKKEKQKMMKSLKVPPIAIIDNIVISEKEAWAYYIISERPYYFLSQGAKLNMANETMMALASLCQSADQKVDCHILINNQPFDPFAWGEDIVDKEYNYNQMENKPFQEFIKEQINTLINNDYKKRYTYIGVKLTTRNGFDTSSLNPLEFGFKDSFRALQKSVSRMFMFNVKEITPDEEIYLKDLEKEIYRNLASSALYARRPTAEECLLTIKRRFYPAMPSPYLETNHEERIGLSDIVIESGGVVEIKPRYLKITQVIDEYEYEGYRAALSVSKIPKDFVFPSPIPPFLHRATMLPFTVNIRFTLVPTEEMKKSLSKKKMETDDEIDNLVKSGQSATESLKNTLRDQQVLEQDLENENLPWISGNYRIVVEADTEEGLKNIIAQLKQEYSESDFVLTWSAGDQQLLFEEEFLGGKLEMDSFALTTNLGILGIAGINYGGKVGDEVKQRQLLKKRR